jgi:hypothetical protein
MQNSTVIGCRVTPVEKALIGEVCRRMDVRESALIRRLAREMAKTVGATPLGATEQPEPAIRCERVSVRLREDDVLLLRERAKARRGVRQRVRAGRIVRAHVQSQLPLPTGEVEA